MEEVIRIIEQIQATNSKNEKLEIIKANAGNELFKKTLKFLLDGNVVTGISKKKIDKKLSAYPEDLSPIDFSVIVNSISEWEACMGYLELNNTGTDNDVRIVQRFIDDQPKERHGFFTKMVTKTLKLGCDAKTVNKAILGLIPTFDVMLGTSIEKCKIKDGSWFSASLKLNGCRCVWYRGDFYTRQGKLITGLEHIISDVQMLPDSENMVYDGELLYKNHEGLSDSEAFQKGAGIVNSKSDFKDELKFVIFDLLPADEFDAKMSIDTYRVRRRKLEELRSKIAAMQTPDLDVVRMFYEGTDQSEIWKWLDYAETNDIEGLMVSLDAPYECKRTKNLIKVKKFYSYDLPIVGCEEGSGRNEGTLGALVVQYKDNTVNVGTGFDDATRKEFWENADTLIGRIAEVKFKECTKDKKTGLDSLQFPVFCGLREVGKEVSYD